MHGTNVKTVWDVTCTVLNQAQMSEPPCVNLGITIQLWRVRCLLKSPHLLESLLIELPSILLAFTITRNKRNEIKVKRKNQQDATNSMFIIKLFVSTCFGHHCAVSYCVNVRGHATHIYTRHTRTHVAKKKPTHSHYQPCLPQRHYGCHILCFHLLTDRTPHAVRHGLILLMMGIMMPETCWDRKFDNKHRISCILLVPPLMFMMRGHKNLKKRYEIKN